MKQFALNKGPENGKNTQVLLFKICALKKKNAESQAPL